MTSWQGPHEAAKSLELANCAFGLLLSGYSPFAKRAQLMGQVAASIMECGREHKPLR